MNKNKLDKVYPVISVTRQDLIESGYNKKKANDISDNDMDNIAGYIAERIEDVISENDIFWTALEEAIEELKK